MMNFDVSSNDKQNLSSSSTNYITTQGTPSSSNTRNTINNISLSTNQSVSNKNNILEDNRKAPIVNGMTPPINGEAPTIKRTYTLRSSTIRKINELKSIHPAINVCVSSIVDIAIDHYHIVNEGGIQ